MSAQTANFAIQHLPQNEAVPTIQLLRKMQGAQVSGAECRLAAIFLCALESAAGGRALVQRTLLAVVWLEGLLAEHELPPVFVADLESLLGALRETLCGACLPAEHMHGIVAELSRIDVARPLQRGARFSARQLAD